MFKTLNRSIRTSCWSVRVCLLNLSHDVVVRVHENAVREQQMRRFRTSGIVPGGVAMRTWNDVIRYLSAHTVIRPGVG